MKVTKKIVDRVTDICAGSGMYWNSHDEFFDIHGDVMECYGNLVQALEFSFDLGDNSRFRYPWRWRDMDSPKSIAEVVCECLEYDS